MNDPAPKSRFLAIKYDWIEKTGNLIDAAVMAYIAGWENDRDRATVKLKIKTMASALGLGDKQVKCAIVRLEAAGLIAKKKTMHCYVYTTRKDVMNALKSGSIETKKDSIIEAKKDSISEPKGTQYRGQKGPDIYKNDLKNGSLRIESSSKQESFSAQEESGNFSADPLAAAAAARPLLDSGPRPRRAPGMVKLTPEQTGLVMQIFGPSGTERKLGEILTPEQADTPGFVGFLLKRLLEIRNAKGLRNPAGMLRTLVESEWRPGWTDPESEADRLRQSKREDFERRLKEEWQKIHERQKRGIA